MASTAGAAGAAILSALSCIFDDSLTSRDLDTSSLGLSLRGNLSSLGVCYHGLSSLDLLGLGVIGLGVHRSSSNGLGGLDSLVSLGRVDNGSLSRRGLDGLGLLWLGLGGLRLSRLGFGRLVFGLLVLLLEDGLELGLEVVKGTRG